MHACMLYDCMNDEHVKVCIDECVKKCTHAHAQNLIQTEFVRNPTALLSFASFVHHLTQQVRIDFGSSGLEPAAPITRCMPMI